jgi:hypothetical protein
MLFLSKRRLNRAQQHRWARISAANERNLAWYEMEREERDWREKVEVARANGWPMPIGGGLIKARFEIANGLRGIESGWDIDTVPIADFGNVNVAGAATIRAGLNTFPLINNAHAVIGSPDNLPFEQPGGLTTALNASRAAGTSVTGLAVVVGVYCVHVTIAAPPTVYQPAGTTANLRVLSSALTVTTTAAPATIATLNVTTAANFVDPLVISAPTERQAATPSGVVLTTASNVYNGDSYFGELAMTGALNHQGTLIYLEMEIL